MRPPPPRPTLFPYTTLFRSTCPSVAIREGTATYAVGLPGKPAAANDLRFQGTIVSYARDCSRIAGQVSARIGRSEEHTSELQSHVNLVCRLLLEKKKKTKHI